MAQRPAASSVTVSPETAQVVAVVDAKFTVRPEEAVALTVNGAEPYGSFESGEKLMVWGVLPGFVPVPLTGNVCVLGEALSTTVIFPVTGPTVVGVNVTVMVHLLYGAPAGGLRM